MWIYWNRTNYIFISVRTISIFASHFTIRHSNLLFYKCNSLCTAFVFNLFIISKCLRGVFQLAWYFSIVIEFNFNLINFEFLFHTNKTLINIKIKMHLFDTVLTRSMKLNVVFEISRRIENIHFRFTFEHVRIRPSAVRSIFGYLCWCY